MRDSLPQTVRKYESGIVNLDSTWGKGSHWTCYKKLNKVIYYYDSFGDLRPPLELLKYFGPGVDIKYNYERHQAFDSVICGHLCLKFLSKNVLY